LISFGFISRFKEIAKYITTSLNLEIKPKEIKQELIDMGFNKNKINSVLKYLDLN
jgi:uncharacterized protein Smg (DUF494 family)